MKTARVLLFIACAALAHSQAADLKKLSVLYIGDLETPRAKGFRELLEPKTAQFEVAARNGFNPSQARRFDVMLLDWPQSDLARQERQGRSPLGTRDEWTTPTVLLGSAGLNLAVVWKVRGGSG